MCNLKVRNCIMIKTIIGLALAGIALTPFADKAVSPVPMQQAEVDPMKTGAMPVSTHLVYQAAAASGAQCRIVVGAADNGIAAARADAGCAAVYPGLETVANWTLAGGDRVRLRNAAGMIVLELGSSDGFAFEAVVPAADQITISEIEI
jgi:hypothetical protein